MTAPFVECTNLVHVYGSAGAEVAALRGVDLEVGAGEMVALLGPSGSGKSTLLWHLAGLLRATAGSVSVAGTPLSTLSASALSALRLQTVGIVVQRPSRNLLGHLSCLDNVVHVQRASRRSRREQRTRALELLDAVGLGGRGAQRAARLSGGEQQRLAVAVALANGPQLLLADEPTSHLDVDSVAGVVELIRSVNEAYGTTVIAVTHDPAVGAALGRTLTMREGLVGEVGIAGRDHLVVRRGGTIQLSAELLQEFPPGSLLRATRDGDSVVLRRASEDEP